VNSADPFTLKSCGGAKVNLQGLVGLLPSYSTPQVVVMVKLAVVA
jgi:hypothetical protein